MRHVLDTNVFYHPRALEHLATLPDDIVVPAVVVAERARQLQRDAAVAPEAFVATLRAQDFDVEPLGVEQACAHAPFLDDVAWQRLARDALIAGHVRPRDTLWTHDRRDFEALGIPSEALVDPATL